MEQQVARKISVELKHIRETLQILQQEVERLTSLIIADNGKPNTAEYMSIVGLGASGIKDISEKHDHYVGQAISREHLR